MLQSLSEDVRECYRHAQDCAEKASNAATPRLRADFLRLEKAWLTLARSYEFTGRISAFQTAPEASWEESPGWRAPPAVIVQ